MVGGADSKKASHVGRRRWSLPAGKAEGPHLQRWCWERSVERPEGGDGPARPRCPSLRTSTYHPRLGNVLFALSEKTQAWRRESLSECRRCVSSRVCIEFLETLRSLLAALLRNPPCPVWLETQRRSQAGGENQVWTKPKGSVAGVWIFPQATDNRAGFKGGEWCTCLDLRPRKVS